MVLRVIEILMRAVIEEIAGGVVGIEVHTVVVGGGEAEVRAGFCTNTHSAGRGAAEKFPAPVSQFFRSAAQRARESSIRVRRIISF